MGRMMSMIKAMLPGAFYFNGIRTGIQEYPSLPQ
jgi:hypothetical protein